MRIEDWEDKGSESNQDQREEGEPFDEGDGTAWELIVDPVLESFATAGFDFHGVTPDWNEINYIGDRFSGASDSGKIQNLLLIDV